MKDETQKILGKFAFDALHEVEGLTHEAFAAFFQKFFYTPWTAQFTKAFVDASNPEARKWFCEIFCEEEKSEPTTEVFYKMGDRFRCESGIYRLTSLGNNMVALIKVEGLDVGHIWTAEVYSVKDPEHITQEEFDFISGRSWLPPNFFTLIKEEEKELEEKEVFYKVGDKFIRDAGIYLLSSFGNKMVALVKVVRFLGLNVGNIWEPFYYDYSVKDPDHITQEEFSRLSAGQRDMFTLIEETKDEEDDK